MVRMTVYVVTLLLSPLAARAQSHGCVERPSGPAINSTAIAPLPHQPRGRVAIAVPTQPTFGQDCVAVMPPVRDVLRGAPPPPGGLLRGEGPGDLLRDPLPTRSPAPWPR